MHSLLAEYLFLRGKQIKDMRIAFSIMAIVWAHYSFAQSEEDRVGQLLGSGNTKELSLEFTPNIDLTVLETDDVYSRAQAAQILKKFFQDHPPKAFSKEHNGKTKAGDSYVIGILSTSNGNFRTTYFLKQVKDEQRVKQLRIEKDRDGLR